MSLSTSKSLVFLGLFLMSMSAKAGLILNIEQVGNDMVASYSGSINLDAVIIEPSSAIFVSGLYSDPNRFGFSVGNSIINTFAPVYEMPNLVPAIGIGTVPYISTADETGDPFGFGYVDTPGFNIKQLILPSGYVSGAFIAGSATYTNTDLFSLDFVGGSYTFSFGQNGISETITLNIQSPALNTVNAPATAAFAILGLILIGTRRFEQTPKLQQI